jgi:sulfite exporter TauE/SafE
MIEREFGLGLFFAIGLLSSAHCLGMCGPLVTLYSDRSRDGDDRITWHQIRQQLLYNFGRTVSYAFIGALMGGLGSLVFDAAAVASVVDPIRGTVGILAGVVIIVTGFAYLRGQTAHTTISVPFIERRVSVLSAGLTRRVERWARGPRIAGLGALHGVFPCPILYPAYLYALATGSPVEGGIALAALGVGTVPALFLYGTVLETVSVGTRVRLHRALGVAFVVLGYLPLSMGLMAFGVHVPHFEIPVFQPLEGGA